MQLMWVLVIILFSVLIASVDRRSVRRPVADLLVKLLAGGDHHQGRQILAGTPLPLCVWASLPVLLKFEDRPWKDPAKAGPRLTRQRLINEHRSVEKATNERHSVEKATAADPVETVTAAAK